jgi:hypothetical protein
MNFKLWFEEIGYHSTRKNWTGGFDKSKLSKYEPANLGFFFTPEKDKAKHFLQKNLGYVHKTDIDTTNIEEIDAKGQNLREFIPFIKKLIKKGKSGVVLNNVIDGIFHQRLFVIFDVDIIKTLDIEPAS